MTIRHLESMFRPKSLALVGASDRPRSVGQVLLQNVLVSGFAGPVMPVNPKHDRLGTLRCYPDIQSLPESPELAVLTIAAPQVPRAIAELGARGTKAAVVISAGFSELGTPEGKKLEQDMLAAAKRHTMRIMGPNCVGVMVPGAKLNASFAHLAPAPGTLAFVSQSGALCTAILDYVAEKDIGFSHFVSLGNASDVDFGDMLDYLAADSATTAILLYIESVGQVRKFMSAARAAARNKPVIVIKSGRNAAGAKAAASHTGALIGSDAVYDVAFRRAGMLRVNDTEELFDAVETLARLTHPPHTFRLTDDDGQPDALAIITNGGGPAVLAADYLAGQGGRLAQLSEPTLAALNNVLPSTWSHRNPVDIIGDADGVRYAAALEALVAAPEAEALFVMKCPTAVSDNLEAAQAVVQAKTSKLLLTCWLGEATALESRRLFAQHNIPTYETPEKAMRAFMHLAQYRHNQAMLMEAPPAVAAQAKFDKTRVQAIIDKAGTEGRAELFESEAKDVLAAYGIPVVKTLRVKNEEEAVAAAQTIGFPVALKILSPDISHKSDVGGVILDLKDADAVRVAAQSMRLNVARLKPQARLEGFTVQQMATRQGYELIVGLSTDQQFGPVIMFGEGGVAVEVIDDKALGLPPLNSLLASEMIKSTRVYRRLKGFRDHKPVAIDAVADVLVQVSQLATDIADIAELDINPLVADDKGVIALDARIRIAKVNGERKLAISPYPEGLEERASMHDGQNVVLRPVRPQDAKALADMLGRLSPQDVYHRFYGEYPVLTPQQAARLAHIDYDREMVLLALPENTPDEVYACLLCTLHPDHPEAEFSVVVRSDKKLQGLGGLLTEKILRYLAKIQPHITTLSGYALADNTVLADMVKELGFSVTPMQKNNRLLVKVSKHL